MRIHTINTGLFKLDGGAMFGVVPKTLWNKLNPADENNMCTWAMRCLLIEDGDRLILIDTGIGDKQSEKFFSYYYLHGDDTLESSIKTAGYGLDEVTDVILTHLHFDHVGGAVKQNGESFYPTFRNATYWSVKDHWHWALNPNAREKASFLKENILPIEKSGQLKFIDQDSSPFENIHFSLADGHTEKQLIPHIQYHDQTLVYCADLVPSAYHIPLPYIMSYDVRPLLAMEEKKALLETALKNDYKLIFEHDPINEAGTLTRTERGIQLANTFKLSDIL